MALLLSAGVKEGCFKITDVGLTATAILMMCSGVSDWFQGHGRLSGSAIADHFAELVLRMVASPGVPATTRATAATTQRRAPAARQPAPARH